MLKNKSGITLAALVATIMIIMVLTTTAIVSYSSFSVSAKKKSFANEIYTITKQIEEYNMRNNRYPIGSARSINVESVDSALSTIFTENGETITNSAVSLYEIDYAKLDLQSLNRGMDKTVSSKDIYLFSTTTKKVYYIAGEKIGDDTYYFLDSNLYESLKMK